jgi:hypothetical protein
MPKNTRMMRKNEGKAPLSFILDFPTALRELAFVMAGGAVKYARNNWKKGAPITEVEDCLMRHLLAYHNCDTTDAESKRHHMAHVIFNAAGIIEIEAMHGDKFDDRDWEHSYE